MEGTERRKFGWTKGLRRIDPRTELKMNICDQCCSEITTVHPELASKKIKIIDDRLLSLLHDETCKCQGETQHMEYVTLLDLVAASNDIGALKACLCQMQVIDKPAASVVSQHRQRSLTIDRTRSKCYTGRVHKSHEFSNVSQQSEEFSTIGTMPGAAECQSFTGDSLENDACNWNQDAKLEFSQNQGEDSRNENHVPVTQTEETFRARLVSVNEGKPDEAENCKPFSSGIFRKFCHVIDKEFDPEILTDVHTLFCYDQVVEESTAKPEADISLGWCDLRVHEEIEQDGLTDEELLVLLKSVSQASLLSMSLYAVHNNSPAIMSCCVVLHPDTMAELVHLCHSLPSSEAVVQLYHLALDSRGCFERVSSEDLQTLGLMSQREEIVQLCRQAWQQWDKKAEQDTEILHLRSIMCDVCKECWHKLFPDTSITGRTIYIKFHRTLSDNSVIFDCIRAGKCPCDNSDQRRHFWPLKLFPACAAAVCGNFSLLKLLSRDCLSHQQDAKLSIPNPERMPHKSCLIKSPRRVTYQLTFSSEEENFGESVISDLLLHALYGGSDECFEFLLQNIAPHSLTPREVLSCLDMALRVGRPDLFLKMAVKFGMNLNTMDEQVSTPLMLAVRFGCTLLVFTLLSLGTNPFARTALGKTAVDIALHLDQPDTDLIAQRLISMTPDEELDEAIMRQALGAPRLNIVKHLMSRGITTARDTNYLRPSRVKIQQIPLVHWCVKYASSSNICELVEFLLSEGQDAATVLEERGVNVMHLALERTLQSDDLLDVLLRYNVSVNTCTENGTTPLFLAIRHNNALAVRSLIQAGASLHCTINNRPPYLSNFSISLSARAYSYCLFLLQAGYVCSSEDIDTLVERGGNLPNEAIQYISNIRSRPLALTSLCGARLREHLQDKLNLYLETVRCPQIVQRFIGLEHLLDRYLSGSLSDWDI